MSNLETIQNAIAFIEANLDQDITISHIADEVGFSLYHFCRLFHELSGCTPYAYLSRRRLTEAAKELFASRETDRNIVDIAFKYRFNSHESFSRSFKREMGLPPNEIKAKESLWHLPLTNPILHVDMLHRAQKEYLEPQIVERSPFCVIGFVGLIRDDTRIITQLWSKLEREVNGIPNPVQPERWYEVAFWPSDYDLDGWFSMPCIEVENLAEIPPSLVGKVIPGGKYARFIHKGMCRNVGLTRKYIYQTWLPKTNYKLAYPFDFEYYGSGFRGPDDPESESEIHIPIE